VTLAAALLTGAAVLFNEWAYPLLHGVADAPRPAIGRVLGGAVYTALLAPLIIGALVRAKRIFGFKGGRLHSSPPRHPAVAWREP
jgi:hypothetical protein